MVVRPMFMTKICSPLTQDGDWFASLSPLQPQLLGYGPDHASFWGIRQDGWIDDEIPLREELKDRGLLDREIPYLR